MAEARVRRSYQAFLQFLGVFLTLIPGCGAVFGGYYFSHDARALLFGIPVLLVAGALVYYDGLGSRYAPLGLIACTGSLMALATIYFVRPPEPLLPLWMVVAVSVVVLVIIWDLMD